MYYLNVVIVSFVQSVPEQNRKTLSECLQSHSGRKCFEQYDSISLRYRATDGEVI